MDKPVYRNIKVSVENFSELLAFFREKFWDDNYRWNQEEHKNFFDNIKTFLRASHFIPMNFILIFFLYIFFISIGYCNCRFAPLLSYHSMLLDGGNWVCRNVVTSVCVEQSSRSVTTQSSLSIESVQYALEWFGFMEEYCLALNADSRTFLIGSFFWKSSVWKQIDVRYSGDYLALNNLNCFHSSFIVW